MSVQQKVGEIRIAKSADVALGEREGRNVVRVEARSRLMSLSPQQGDLRLLGPPSSRSADGGARTRNRRVPADLRADSQVTVPQTPPGGGEGES
ncbi:hypothetical protein PoB_004467500 [Plakobranchus ocellatus]|uniref:Uncharacterized protein n=1 Tax=Plakobranchus ocellatus TaxID=259542 RepID=A0AAV4BF44_9GAST|nr:hypothetical protein PoB_004467500 [Plakobranchus ocellatus]